MTSLHEGTSLADPSSVCHRNSYMGCKLVSRIALEKYRVQVGSVVMKGTARHFYGQNMHRTKQI